MEVSNEAMVASRLFDAVPECLIETLLIVHGSGDRNSPQFTQVCETWTRILAPWIRTLIGREWPWGKEHARWNGKCYFWYVDGQLWQKGADANGKREGVWQNWYGNGQLRERSVYANGKWEGEWQWWHLNGQLRERGVYANGRAEGECSMWYDNGQLRSKGIYANDAIEGVWQVWDENGASLGTEVYHNGEFVPNQ